MILIVALVLQVQQIGHLEKEEGREEDLKGDGEVTGAGSRGGHGAIAPPKR